MFEVEWCYELPEDHNGADPDRAKFKVETFKSADAAIRRAKKLLARDCFGSVRVNEIAQVLNSDITEAIGRPYYEGETIRTCYVDDESREYTERDWERY